MRAKGKEYTRLEGDGVDVIDNVHSTISTCCDSFIADRGLAITPIPSVDFPCMAPVLTLLSSLKRLFLKNEPFVQPSFIRLFLSSHTSEPTIHPSPITSVTVDNRAGFWMAVRLGDVPEGRQ